MSTKHTPGPWELIAEPQLTIVVASGEPRIDGKAFGIALIPHGDGVNSIPWEIKEANASLISAAPDHAMLLRAIGSGIIRWERWDAEQGELCIGGIRYATFATTSPKPRPLMTRGKEVFRMSFVAADDGQPPPANRIRMLLKHALRSLGLRCTRVDGGDGEPPDRITELLEAIHDDLRLLQERLSRPTPEQDNHGARHGKRGERCSNGDGATDVSADVRAVQSGEVHGPSPADGGGDQESGPPMLLGSGGGGADAPLDPWPGRGADAGREEGRVTLRLSSTTLEAYRRIVHGAYDPSGDCDPVKEAAAIEELVASIKGKPFPAKWQMNAGKAFHELLADPGIDVAMVPPMSDDARHEMLAYRPQEGDVKAAVMRVRLAEVKPVKRGNFSFSENAIALGRKAVGPGVWEVKGTRTLTVAGHEVVLVAQADHWRGLHLSDAKATWSSPKMGDFEPNLQWRAYLLVHGAESFTFNKFCFREPKGPDGYCELREHLKTTFYAYPQLEEDLRSWISEFVSWASIKGLLGYLVRESSTPVYEDAA